MKRILLTIGVLFTSQSFAAEPVFCSSPTMSHQSGCVSTCAAIADAGSYVLSSGSYGFCEGDITKSTIYIYKVELGSKTDVSESSRCTIWEDNDLSVEFTSKTGNMSSDNPTTLKNCTVGTTYDALYLTMGRHEKIAGDSVFPDGTGKIVRTTSVFSGKDTGHTNLTSLNTWRDIGSADSTLQYVIPDAGSSGKVFKKIVATPSNDDLSSSSNIEMFYDTFKTTHSSHTFRYSDTNFYCEEAKTSADDKDYCVSSIDGDDSKYIQVYSMAVATGFPITLKEGDETLDITYTGSVTGDQDEGIEFMWYNDGGTLKYVGARFGSNDGASLGVSNVRSNEGL